MNFQIDVNSMQRVLSNISAVAKLNSPDNTGRVLVRAQDNGVLFVANNNETAIQINIDSAVVTEPGEAVFSYSELRSFIPKFTPWDGEVGSKEFDFKSMKSGYYIYVDTVHTNGAKSRGKVKVKEYSAFGFPVPKAGEEIAFILNSDVLKPAFAKVIYAVDQHETRPHLRGLNMTFVEDFIYFAGTNGKMLSEYKVGNVSNRKEGSVLLKYDFVATLNKILPSNNQVFFYIGDGKITASFDNVILTGREVIGQVFPKYHHILNDFKHSIKVSKDVLFENLKPLVDSLDSDDNSRLTIAIRDRSLLLSSDRAEFVCDDNVNHDGNFIIDVNGLYLLKTIEAIKDDLIIIKFTDDNSNLIFDSGNFEDQKSLITPVKRRTDG